MSNTQKRILSGLFLVAIVIASIAYGKVTTRLFVFVAALICVDEIYSNFFGLSRKSIQYFLSQVLFTAPYLYLNFFGKDLAPVFSLFVYANLALNIFLVIYLFFFRMESEKAVTFTKKVPISAGLLILLPMISLSSILFFEKWPHLVMNLLFVNFGMDTGAWLFGKLFGKRKLWPSVSPNKTVEGFFGGIATSAVLGIIYWINFVGDFRFSLLVLFAILGGLSQVGDLIQSKIKRQFGIKDSSTLIPGHGGVYDRIDSLVFVAPFYVVAVIRLHLS